MTVKEKFENVEIMFESQIGSLKYDELSEASNQCEQIADEFAIELLNFIEGTYSYSNIFDHWYLHADTSKTFTKKELLEIYKKEKGL